MEVIVHDTIAAQRAILEAAPEQRLANCRDRLLEPLRPTWAPMLGLMPQSAGADADTEARSAARMIGLFNLQADPAENLAALDRLAAADAQGTLRAALARAARAFTEAGRALPMDKVEGSIVLGDQENRYFMDTVHGYSGSGAILGYVIITIWPNDYTLPRLGPAAVHEFHHNMRLHYAPFTMNISVGEYIVLEGLAESFTAALYRPDLVGPWVTGLSPAEIDLSRGIIGQALDVSGFNNVRPYLFGDPAAASSGYSPVGLPACAGYAIGYRVVQAYLLRTGRTIIEATFTPAAEIIAESGYFA